MTGPVLQLPGRLSDADARLTAIEKQQTAVLKDPTAANVERLDRRSPSATSRRNSWTLFLERQAVQRPGEFVLMDSDQLGGLQTAGDCDLGSYFGAGAPTWAPLPGRGWRALMAGGGIVVATLFHSGHQAPDRVGARSLPPRPRCPGRRGQRPSGRSFPMAFASGRSQSRHRRRVSVTHRRPRLAVRRFLAPYLDAVRSARSPPRTWPCCSCSGCRSSPGSERPTSPPVAGDRPRSPRSPWWGSDPAPAETREFPPPARPVPDRLQRFRVSDRTRTRDHLDHNQELLQLTTLTARPLNVQ